MTCVPVLSLRNQCIMTTKKSAALHDRWYSSIHALENLTKSGFEYAYKYIFIEFRRLWEHMYIFRRHLEARLFLSETRHEFTNRRIKIARYREITRTFWNSEAFQECPVRVGVPAYVYVCCCKHVSIFKVLEILLTPRRPNSKRHQLKKRKSTVD
jgi:hypothetical protein